MEGRAYVVSVEALKDLRIALAKYARAAGAALEEAQSEVKHTQEWLRNEGVTENKRQVQFWSEKLAQAQSALKRRELMELSPVGGHYSYVDEKKAIAKAQRELEEAQRRLKNVQRGRILLEKEAFNFTGQLNRLNRRVEMDIPEAMERLDRMMMAIESYSAVAPETAVEGQTMTRPEDETKPLPKAEPSPEEKPDER